MELAAYIADWPEVVKRAGEGMLESTMIDCDTGDLADWLQEPEEWMNYSKGDYGAAAEAWEAIRHRAAIVPEDMGAKAREFMNGLITYEGFFNDLETGREQIEISLSPETTERLTQLVAAVDFSLYRDAYYSSCDMPTKERFSTKEGGIDSSFEDGFLPYVQMWKDVIKAAALQKKGLLVRWC